MKNETDNHEPMTAAAHNHIINVATILAELRTGERSVFELKNATGMDGKALVELLNASGSIVKKTAGGRFQLTPAGEALATEILG